MGDAEPRRVLLIGDPVAHSISPAIHNAAFTALGVDAVYEARRVAATDLDRVAGELRRGALYALNVTVPHKEAMARYADTLSDEARAIGAINTLVRDGDSLHVDNADARGLLAALEETLGLVPYGMRILLLGAGGAARAAAVGLAQGGPAGLAIYNRHATRAEALATVVHDRFGGRIRAVDAEGARLEGRDCDLIVNATSAGLDGESRPLDGLEPRPGAAYYDMIYNPVPTPLMRDLRAHGTAVADGLSMLVHQAALLCRLWTGYEAPLGVMRAAAVDELRRRTAGASGSEGTSA